MIKTKNSSKTSSITSILISISSQKTRKEGHHSRPVGEQGRNLKRHSLSPDKNDRRQGQDFRGHWLQSQYSTSGKFGEFPEIKREIGTRRAWKNHQTSGQQWELWGVWSVKHKKLARTKEIDGISKIASLKTFQNGQRLRSQRKKISKVLEYPW